MMVAQIQIPSSSEAKDVIGVAAPVKIGSPGKEVLDNGGPTCGGKSSPKKEEKQGCEALSWRRQTSEETQKSAKLGTINKQSFHETKPPNYRAKSAKNCENKKKPTGLKKNPALCTTTQQNTVGVLAAANINYNKTPAGDASAGGNNKPSSVFSKFRDYEDSSTDEDGTTDEEAGVSTTDAGNITSSENSISSASDKEDPSDNEKKQESEAEAWKDVVIRGANRKVNNRPRQAPTEPTKKNPIMETRVAAKAPRQAEPKKRGASDFAHQKAQRFESGDVAARVVAGPDCPERPLEKSTSARSNTTIVEENCNVTGTFCRAGSREDTPSSATVSSSQSRNQSDSDNGQSAEELIPFGECPGNDRAGKDVMGRRVSKSKHRSDPHVPRSAPVHHIIIDGANIVRARWNEAGHDRTNDARLLAAFYSQVYRKYSGRAPHAKIKIYISHHIYHQWQVAKIPCILDLPKKAFEFGIHGVDMDTLIWKDAIKVTISTGPGVLILSNDKFDDIDLGGLYFETLDECDDASAWQNCYTQYAAYEVDALKEAIRIGRYCLRQEPLGEDVFSLASLNSFASFEKRAEYQRRALVSNKHTQQKNAYQDSGLRDQILKAQTVNDRLTKENYGLRIKLDEQRCQINEVQQKVVSGSAAGALQGQLNLAQATYAQETGHLRTEVSHWQTECARLQNLVAHMSAAAAAAAAARKMTPISATQSLEAVESEDGYFSCEEELSPANHVSCRSPNDDQIGEAADGANHGNASGAINHGNSKKANELDGSFASDAQQPGSHEGNMFSSTTSDEQLVEGAGSVPLNEKGSIEFSGNVIGEGSAHQEQHDHDHLVASTTRDAFQKHVAPPGLSLPAQPFEMHAVWGPSHVNSENPMEGPVPSVPGSGFNYEDQYNINWNPSGAWGAATFHHLPAAAQTGPLSGSLQVDMDNMLQAGSQPNMLAPTPLDFAAAYHQPHQQAGAFGVNDAAEFPLRPATNEEALAEHMAHADAAAGNGCPSYAAIAAGAAAKGNCSKNKPSLHSVARSLQKEIAGTFPAQVGAHKAQLRGTHRSHAPININFETCVKERRLSTESLVYYQSLSEMGKRKVKRNFRHTLHEAADDVDHHFLRFACITKHGLDRERNERPEEFVVIAKIIDQLQEDQLRYLFHRFEHDASSSSTTTTNTSPPEGKQATILDTVRNFARKLHFTKEWRTEIPSLSELLAAYNAGENNAPRGDGSASVALKSSEGSQ